MANLIDWASEAIHRGQRRVVEAVRWRVGYFEGRGLPAYPIDGLRSRDFVIRPFRLGDAAEYSRLAASPSARTAVIPHIESGAQTWVRKTNDHINKMVSPYEFAITAGKEERFIGVVALVRLEDIGYSVEYGIALFPEEQGTAATLRVTRAVIDWLLSSGAHRVVTRHFADNSISHRSNVSFGLKHEGVMKGLYPPSFSDSDVWRDACIHAIVNPADPAETTPPE